MQRWTLRRMPKVQRKAKPVRKSSRCSYKEPASAGFFMDSMMVLKTQNGALN
jgi:hypothetical protein